MPGPERPPRQARGAPFPDATDALEEAARALAAESRFAEAGRVLLPALQLGVEEAARVPPGQRRLARKAAIFLARGGEHRLAAQLFLAIGDSERAAASFEQAGDKVAAALVAGRARGGISTGSATAGDETPERLKAAGHADLAIQSYVALGRFADAAELARELGRHAEAAALFLDAGMPFAAATCYFEAEDLARSLDALVRVPRGDPNYRVACVEAIARARALDVASLELENLLGEFIRSGPQGDEENEAFCVLAELYLGKSFTDDAREVLDKAVRARPGNPLAEGLLAELNARSAPWSPQPLEGLPDLPPRPPAPRIRTRRIEAPVPELAAAAGPPVLVAGMTVAGRYALVDVIGRGGMSIVFRADDLELGEGVALKFLLQGLFDGLHGAERLKQELKLSRQLLHPNIVRLYDIGTFRGVYYLSMELLSGKDLAELLKRGTPLPIPTALDYLIDACAALQAAHDKGIVHRDIKPSNLFVITSGSVKMMDFGIAKLHAAPSLTSSNLIVGTPSYIAPEQITGFSAVTPAADLYSLGVVAFEMLTGTLPFWHPDPMPLLKMHLDAPAPRLRDRNPAVPAELEAIVLKLLEKKPAQRPGSPREVAAALEAIRQRG
jgi:tetratricopeptide (TPR) repeat protein